MFRQNIYPKGLDSEARRVAFCFITQQNDSVHHFKSKANRYCFFHNLTTVPNGYAAGPSAPNSAHAFAKQLST
jgi:hypothetical protein